MKEHKNPDDNLVRNTNTLAGNNMADFSSYTSPFSWRYGSTEMRRIWSLDQTRLLWRELWVALAEVQGEYGLVNPEQIAELRQNHTLIDLERSQQIEEMIQHDLMAELKVFAEQCPGAGGILHLGATSMDIKDNASVLQQKKALELLLKKTSKLLEEFAMSIQARADLPIIAFTHLQPAEPSTLGYRLAQTGQDLLDVHALLEEFLQKIRSKGFTGAVGSSASFASLLGLENLPEFQAKLARKLELDFFEVSSQTYPRQQDYWLLCLLAGLGSVLHKFAFDLRILQSPGLGELAEPFGTDQVGSSAMPFKKNPIRAEKINSLGRQLAQLPRIAWDNAANSLLERTLDDSANRRTILPEAFLAADEMVESCQSILEGLIVNTRGISRNLADYGPFAATEDLLMKLVKAGADRQEMHAVLREHSLKAWESLQDGDGNPLSQTLGEDPDLLRYISKSEIKSSLEDNSYIGDSGLRARNLAQKILARIGRPELISG